MQRFLATTLAGVTLAAGSFLAGAPAALATEDECPGGHWPARAVGKPPSAQPGMTGLAIWLNRDGWHLAASEEGEDKAIIKGTIVTDGVIHATGRATEGNDKVVQVGRHAVAYRFVNYGHVDALDFRVRCASFVRFNAAIDGTQVDPSQVVVGHEDTHPESVPFRIPKVA